MKNITVASLVAAPLLAFAMATPSFADTTCKDGTTTTSTGKGTCSGHGGVQKSAAAAATPAPAVPAAAAPATPAAPASGATTTCKDGTTTASTGKGTCSGHGGVQKATKAKPATAAMTPAPAAAPAAVAPAAAAPAASTTAAKTSTATKSAPVASASNTDPTGASAKCKDGTYSKSQHRSGTCSSHGGVAEWLAGAPAQ
jgi:hypothetical protein